MNSSEKFHILCVRFSSLGDIILHSSVVSAIKQRWGEQVHLSYLTSKEFVPLLEGHKDIDEVIGFNRDKGVKGLKKLFKLVKDVDKNRKIDLIVDFHATLRSLAIRTRFMHIPRIYVDKRTVERWLLTTFKFDFLSCQGRHPLLINKGLPRDKGFGELLLERNVRDFQSIFDYGYDRKQLADYVLADLQNPNQNLPISSCAQTYIESQEWKRPDYQYICVCPSASFPEKRWPVERFHQLLDQLCSHDRFKAFKLVILAGPKDDFCQRFGELENKYPGQIVNLQGKTSLVETTYWVKHAFMVVGNDTGVPHIAEAVGVPSVFILGPTGEQFGFYPHLKYSQTVFKSLWCRPCTTNGKGNCIRSQRFCLTRIMVDDVIDKMSIVDKDIRKIG